MTSKLLFSGQLNLLLPRSPYSLCHRFIYKNENNSFDRSKSRKKPGSKFSEMLENSTDRNFKSRNSSTKDLSIRDSSIQDPSIRDSSIRDSSNRESSFEVWPHSYRKAPFSQHIKKLELKTLFQVTIIMNTSPPRLCPGARGLHQNSLHC
jgi:hypothetical protein